MKTIVVYTPQISNRLKYVLDWLLVDRMQLNYTITTHKNDVSDSAFSIMYGADISENFCIPNCGLLFEKGYKKQTPAIGIWQNLPTLFDRQDDNCTLPFDLFAALFYLLSRYEEYDTHLPDKHNRYPATESILYKNGWLLRPLVDEWVMAFRQLLVNKFGFKIAPLQFTYLPTYDIDMAYSHLHKGAERIIGAYLRSLLTGNFRQLAEKTRILKKKQTDPYDAFAWIHELHKKIKQQPKYFILAAQKTTAYDKNIHPQHPAMVRIIKNLAKDGEIGIHPSYYANDAAITAQEKQLLEQVALVTINTSRQHYIKLKIPDTYSLLMQLGITDDYSMGYGTKLGFRAGTGCSFLWYDIAFETITPLRIHPFCFMDTTALYEEQLTAKQAFILLNNMANLLKQTGSTLTTIFHNFSLGTAVEWVGWKEYYETFLLSI